MSRRGHTRRVNCTAEGCREFAIYHFNSLREIKESDTLKRPWRCVRHSNPDAVMALDNLTRSETLTATKVKDLKGLFWYRDGAKTGSGFTYGPGFKAFASDFPEGAKITISATIQLP